MWAKFTEDTSLIDVSAWAFVDAADPDAQKHVMGLAEGMGVPFQTWNVTLKAPFRWMPHVAWPLGAFDTDNPIEPPWPNVVLASGFFGLLLASRLKSLSRGRIFTVAVHPPDDFPLEQFDFVLSHCISALEGERVYSSGLALHRTTLEKLNYVSRVWEERISTLPQPWIGALIGRSNAYFRWTKKALYALVEDLKALQRTTGGGLVVLYEADVPAAVANILREVFRGGPTLIFRDDVNHASLGVLAICDYFIVTQHSLSLFSEAASTDKPLFVYSLAECTLPLLEKVNTLSALKLADLYGGSLSFWARSPYNRMPEAVKEIIKRLRLHAESIARSET